MTSIHCEVRAPETKHLHQFALLVAELFTDLYSTAEIKLNSKTITISSNFFFIISEKVSEKLRNVSKKKCSTHSRYNKKISHRDMPICVCHFCSHDSKRYISRLRSSFFKSQRLQYIVINGGAFTTITFGFEKKFPA